MIIDTLKWVVFAVVIGVASWIFCNLLGQIQLLSETKILGLTLAWIFALWLALPIATLLQRRISWLRPRGVRS